MPPTTLGVKSLTATTDKPLESKAPCLQLIAPDARVVAQKSIRLQISIMDLLNTLMEVSLKTKHTYKPREDLIEELTGLNSKLEKMLNGSKDENNG